MRGSLVQGAGLRWASTLSCRATQRTYGRWEGVRRRTMMWRERAKESRPRHARLMRKDDSSQTQNRPPSNHPVCYPNLSVSLSLCSTCRPEKLFSEAIRFFIIHLMINSRASSTGLMHSSVLPTISRTPTYLQTW